MADARKKTRFLIYESSRGDTGAVLELVAEQEASGADEALRLFFAKLDVERAGVFAAVSENSCKLRRRSVASEPKVRVTELGPPRMVKAPTGVITAADEDEQHFEEPGNYSPVVAVSS